MAVGEVARTDHRGGVWKRGAKSFDHLLERDHHLAFEDHSMIERWPLLVILPQPQLHPITVYPQDLNPSLFCVSLVGSGRVPSCTGVGEIEGWRFVWWTLVCVAVG